MNTQTPKYIVSFINQRSKGDDKAYTKMAEYMVKLASENYECLGVTSARNEDGMGITLSYWPSMEAIKTWRDDIAHKKAQQLGNDKWYKNYRLTIAKIEVDRFKIE